MKKASFLPMFLIFFATTFVDSWAHASGEPGCLKQIQGQVVTDHDAKSLSPVCREFRKRYLAGLQSLSSEPEKFFKSLAREISAGKTPVPPYTALLLATLSLEHAAVKDAALIKAIDQRAQVEARLKVPFRYGEAARERLKLSVCKHYPDPFYSEICEHTDPVYQRVIELGKRQAVSR